MRDDRASSTARLIAAATVLASLDPDLRGLVAPHAAEWCARFLSTTASDRRLLSSVTRPGLRAVWRWLERRLCPGVIRHWLLRKHRIEQLARQATLDTETLVVLGSGLDTLPFRLAEERLFDRILLVDHPATQSVVRRALESRAIDGTPVMLLPIDLAHGNVRDVMASAAPRGNTLVIAEGLLMYFNETRVRVLLRDLCPVGGAKVRVIATFMNTPPGEAIGFRGQSAAIGSWLRARGEPMRWSITEPALRPFLSACGLEHTQSIEIDDAHDALRGESIFVAEGFKGSRPRTGSEST